MKKFSLKEKPFESVIIFKKLFIRDCYNNYHRVQSFFFSDTLYDDKFVLAVK